MCPFLERLQRNLLDDESKVLEIRARVGELNNICAEVVVLDNLYYVHDLSFAAQILDWQL